MRKPRIKAGSVIVPISPTATFIGNTDRGIEINYDGARAIISALDGTTSVEDVASSSQVPIEIVLKLVEYLDEHNLIDDENTIVHLPGRYKEQDQSGDAGYIQFHNRARGELAVTTWRDGVRDGGVALLEARQRYGVEIFGENRIATALFGILLASGITQTYFSRTSRRERPRVEDCDLESSYLRAGDIGEGFHNRLTDLSRELSLFPFSTDGLADEAPTKFLKVFIGKVDSEHIAQALSDGDAHLLISVPDGPSLDIGPLVIPGKSACIRCVKLARADQFPSSSTIDLYRQAQQPQEIPVSASHHIAGYLAAEIISFFETGTSSLIAHRAHFNYLTPSVFDRTRYSRHPLCGCSWR